ncbi:MAG TPA: magnesium transporter [Candidatus Limnocylindrales bacterium]|nr:magnesium transporter [Candidatus Limnocylindrales bacterium]
MVDSKEPILEDDEKEKVSLMIEHRLPWLVIGLVGGIALTLVSSKFEHLLSRNIGLTYFIPIIVYMADAVGTQTQTVYVRNIGKKGTHFLDYLFKEFILGIAMGGLFGVLAALFAFFAFKSVEIGVSVGFAMAATMSIAPIIALVVPAVLRKEHKDPAVGAGPFTTVVQDFLSLLIYFAIATVIIF